MLPHGARSQRAAPHVSRQIGLWASIAPSAAIGRLSYFSMRAFVRNAEHAGDTRLLLRDIDLLFTDLVMPGAMNRRDLAVAAAARRPGRRVLLTTGDAEAAVHNGDGNPLRAPFIGKPRRKADLARTLRKAPADDTKDKERN